MSQFEYCTLEESLAARQKSLDVDNEKFSKIFLSIGTEINILLKSGSSDNYTISKIDPSPYESSALRTHCENLNKRGYRCSVESGNGGPRDNYTQEDLYIHLR